MFHLDAINEGNARPSPSATTENVVAVNKDDAGEYTSLKDTRVTTKPVSDGSEQPLLKSDSEGSTSGSESAMGALYARIARLSKNSKEEEDSSTAETKASDKASSPEKTKPRPPDPSTKPKVSWIHGNSGANQTEKGHAPSPPKEKKRTTVEGSGKGDENQRSKEKSSKKCEQKNQDGKGDGNDSPSKTKSHKTLDPIEHINGAVQNALKKIGNFHSDRKTSDTTKEPPKSPNIMHPHINSEAATLLAAQLKEKTQSLNRNEGLSVGFKPNGVSTPQANKEKPTPPQKAKRSVTGANKPLLTTSNNLQKMIASVTDSTTPEPQSPEMHVINGTQIGDAGDATPKKTPIKKPPRKKGKETTSETEPKTTPKMAIMPPQIVK